MQLRGKVVLVTGASAGIGEAISRRFAQLGAHVVLTARRKDRIEKICRDLGEGHMALGCDVTRDGDVELAVEETLKRYGRLDVVVANAGFGVVGEVDSLKLEDYRRQFETNVFGVLRTIKASIAPLKKTRGHIGILGSVNGFVALPANSPYGMSKFAVRALCDSFYHEMAPFGVSVTHIAPGFVVSEIRKVDNNGLFRPGARDRIPSFLQMPAETAARIIVSAIMRRKREKVVTAHGQFIVWLQKHFSWLTPRVIRLFGVSARPEPAK